LRLTALNNFADLAPGEDTGEFQGHRYEAGISFIEVNAPPGDGPKLYRHPYEEVTLVQGSSSLSGVDAATDTVTLAQPQGGQWANLQNAQGAWLSFNQDEAVGRYLQVVAVDAASLKLTLSDPNNYLSLADMTVGAMTPRPHVGIASYNSVVNNQVGWDISFHIRDTETWRGIPAYASANTSTNGVADYNDGTYVFLAGDPNP
jgi:hypothetical protein